MRATQARMDAQQVRFDECMEAIRRDIRANTWSAIEVAAVVVGTIITLLR